jgi:cephalosporin hydroxylase
VYIDSDHSYDLTKLELEILHKKVKEGGYILLHDYIWIDYISEKYKSYGVIKAVNEFCVNFNYEFIYISMEPNMYHTVCLRKLI